MSVNGNNQPPLASFSSVEDILSAFTVLRPQHCHHHGLSHLPFYLVNLPAILSPLNITNQQPPLAQSLFCIQLSSCSILINISSCCLLTPRPLSRFQKSKAVTFSLTRISYQPSETNWVQFTKTLVLSKLSVLNFFSSFESSFRIQDFNPDHLRILWRNKYSSDILSMGMQNIHTVCTYYT